MFLLLGAFKAFSNPKTDSLIQVLVRAIEKKDVSVKARLQRIDQLKQKLASLNAASPDEKFWLYNAIYNEYKTFIYDSAFSYAKNLIQTSYQLKDNSKIGYVRLVSFCTGRIYGG
jgi:hypothetical protein